LGDISTLKNDKSRAAQLSNQLAIAEQQLAELKQVLWSKETSIADLTQQYERLEKDYTRLSDVRAIDAEEINAKQMEITRLQQELDQWKDAMQPKEPEPRNRFRAVTESDPPPATVRRPVPVTPPAMKDNLVFGDAQPSFRAARGLLTDQMSDTELRDKYQALTREKDEKERSLNRAAPKGAKIARVRVEKEELEQEVMQLSAQISKIKSEMNKRGIF
jgi:chromosome segregation ATPase